MEPCLINPHNYALNPHAFPLPNLISKNHHNCDDDDDIEMVALHAKNYTSLKDLLPASPPSTASPRDSWREIPIKDPLLQHAAWAYLQPAAAAPDGGEAWWWRRMQKKCGWLLECFNDVVLAVFEGWFSAQVSERLAVKFE